MRQNILTTCLYLVLAALLWHVARQPSAPPTTPAGTANAGSATSNRRICSTTTTPSPARTTTRRAQMYVSPLPVPANVGHTYTTYQPFMPHEYTYSHQRGRTTPTTAAPAGRAPTFATAPAATRFRSSVPIGTTRCRTTSLPCTTISTTPASAGKPTGQRGSPTIAFLPRQNRFGIRRRR